MGLRSLDILVMYNLISQTIQIFSHSESKLVEFLWENVRADILPS